MVQGERVMLAQVLLMDDLETGVMHLQFDLTRGRRAGRQGRCTGR